MPFEQFNSTSKTDSQSGKRVRVTATEEALKFDPDSAMTGARFWLQPLAGVMAIMDGASKIRLGGVVASTESTRITVQTFANAQDQFAKFRLFVIEASAEVKILDLLGNQLQELAQGEWVDINCDPAGIMTSITTPATFTATTLPSGSATLYSDMNQALYEIQQ